MSAARASWIAWLRRMPLAAAFLALLLQLAFPAGFMAAEPGQGHGGIPIVICTAQGQTMVDWDPATGGEHKPKAPAKSMAGCPFAGHATSAPPAPPLGPVVPVVFETRPEPPGAFTVSPGRGLAAPPPPAIGPPARA